MRQIALVEDYPDNRLLFRSILSDEFEVTEYTSGAAALAGFAERVPDLVLLDIAMPDMDGMEVLRRMRSDPELAGVPAIALTAHAMLGDRERFLRAGFNGYVAKPVVDWDVLLDAIDDLLPVT